MTFQCEYPGQVWPRPLKDSTFFKPFLTDLNLLLPVTLLQLHVIGHYGITRLNKSNFSLEKASRDQ